MRIKETKVYPFDELADEVKDKVVVNLGYINAEHEWWEFTFEDATQVKLKLTEFNLDRGSFCKGDFIECAEDTAQAIIENHGPECETYKTGMEYKADRNKLVTKYSDGEQTNIVTEDNEYDFDNECDELDGEFLRDILEDYRIILQKEYEYLTGEEAIIETIKANEYEFTEDGNLA